jgi:hypothetical protein
MATFWAAPPHRNAENPKTAPVGGSRHGRNALSSPAGAPDPRISPGTPMTMRALPPRLDVAHVPTAESVAAGFALQPCLRGVSHIARQEVAALRTALQVDGCERRDGAMRAGQRVFPRRARFAAAVQQGRRGGAGDREIGAREGDRLARFRDRAGDIAVDRGEQGAEVAGSAAGSDPQQNPGRGRDARRDRRGPMLRL